MIGNAHRTDLVTNELLNAYFATLAAGCVPAQKIFQSPPILLSHIIFQLVRLDETIVAIIRKLHHHPRTSGANYRVSNVSREIISEGTTY